MEIDLGKLPFDIDFHPSKKLVAAGLITGDLQLYHLLPFHSVLFSALLIWLQFLFFTVILLLTVDSGREGIGTVKILQQRGKIRQCPGIFYFVFAIFLRKNLLLNYVQGTRSACAQ